MPPLSLLLAHSWQLILKVSVQMMGLAMVFSVGISLYFIIQPSPPSPPPVTPSLPLPALVSNIINIIQHIKKKIQVAPL